MDRIRPKKIKRQMTNDKKGIPFLQVLWILAIVLFTNTLPAQNVTATVRVSKAAYGSIAKVVEGHGIIQPFPDYDAKISALLPLRIDSILVKPGDRVHKGQPVVKLQRDFSQDMAVQKAKISMEQAKVNLNRAETLFKNGVISRVNLEQAQTEYKLAKADYELQKRSLQYAIENSILRSPIDGVVSSVYGVVGQVADPAQVLVHIVNTKHLMASIGIETEDMEKIKVGQPADLLIPNLSDHNIIHGHVIKQNKEIDPATQLVHIWIQIDNKEQILQPGMFAVARIFVRRIPNALIIPRSAMLKDSLGYYVFTVENNIARKVHITPGIITDKKVQVLKGLKPRALIVYLGNYELEDGMRVKIKLKN